MQGALQGDCKQPRGSRDKPRAACEDTSVLRIYFASCSQRPRPDARMKATSGIIGNDTIYRSEVEGPIWVVAAPNFIVLLNTTP